MKNIDKKLTEKLENHFFTRKKMIDKRKSLLQTLRGKIANKLKNWLLVFLILPTLLAAILVLFNAEPKETQFMLLFIILSALWGVGCMLMHGLYEKYIQLGISTHMKNDMINKMFNIKKANPKTESIIKRYYEEMNENKDIPTDWWINFHCILINAEKNKEENLLEEMKNELGMNATNNNEEQIIIANKVNKKADLI